MALRSVKTPTLIYNSAALAVHNRQPSFYGLRLKPTKFRCSASALTPQLKDTLEKLVNSEKVVLFMKGTRDFPMCGFSNTVVQIVKNLNVPFEDVNILENEILRQGLKEYSNP
ncbi:unnamed protein product [Arabidopsis lyrata]|uniref:Glutaredoxin domain-containing protein n=1 Tax=Arabidopsis lyrata subsp. lyrata TaxID=81972 RepID=D7KKB0_ARALL|nr:hypothetical protein ARALYDRAFT_336548 [Arabidopsis lyrata subsp. lyrata]CAH8254422.1 unnamed protein product [Arabidopsis lyrata]